MSNEVRAHYSAALSSLNDSSKPVINFLTMLAHDYIDHAEVVVDVIADRLRKHPTNNIHYLYLVDSIVKNVGEKYTVSFEKHLPDLVKYVMGQGNDATRQRVIRTRGTWTMFSPDVLRKIDEYIASLNQEPFLPTSHPPPPQPATVATPQIQSAPATAWPSRDPRLAMRSERQTSYPTQPPPAQASGRAPGHGHPLPTPHVPPVHSRGPMSGPAPPGPGPLPIHARGIREAHARPHSPRRGGPPPPGYGALPPPHDVYPPHPGPPRPGYGEHRPMGRRPPPLDAHYPDSRYGMSADEAEIAAAEEALLKAEHELQYGALSIPARRALERAVDDLHRKLMILSRRLPPRGIPRPEHPRRPPAAEAARRPPPDALLATPPRAAPVSTTRGAMEPVTPTTLLQQMEQSGLLELLQEAAPEQKAKASGSKPKKPTGEVDLSDIAVVELTDLSIKETKEDGYITLMYDAQPTQCKQCGLRFPDNTSEEFKLHYDWHFKRNQERQQAAVVSRNWYLSEKDWIEYSGSSLEEMPATGLESQKQQEEAAQRARDILANQRVKAKGSQRCKICHEPFQTFFDDEDVWAGIVKHLIMIYTEEWLLKDAMETGDGLFHISCYEVASKPELNATSQRLSSTSSESNIRLSLADDAMEAETIKEELQDGNGDIESPPPKRAFVTQDSF
eukprot:m.154113 g.154113  ORF g.154113 m.154113 type:complete len:675 (-) comp16248_c0_seq10:169-2193(-)